MQAADDYYYGFSDDRRSSGRRRAPLYSVILLCVLLLAAGFALWPLLSPLPQPTARQAVPVSYQIPGEAPKLPWPARGQATVDIEGLGRIGSSGEQSPSPIASVAKVMTSYLILTRHPLTKGEGGPQLTITPQQATETQQAAQRGESYVPVKAGAVFTERQALQAVLLPSANNMSRFLAAWDAGTVEAFVAAMNATAAELGMSNTRYTDPAGYDKGTVSTATDQVILVRKAMQLPAFAEIVAMPTATLPVAGTVRNVNSLLGKDGVIGVKTGNTDAAGGCLAFAATVTVGGRQVTMVGTVLGQPGTGGGQQLSAAFTASRDLVRAVTRTLASQRVVTAGQKVAVLRGALGDSTTLTAASDLQLVGWPGMTVRLSVKLPKVPDRVAAGAEVGQLAVSATDGTGGEGAASVSLRTTGQLSPPTVWARILHHR